LFESHRHAELGEAVGEVGGAVEGIDVPAELGVEAVAGAFFAEDTVLGKDFAEARADELLAGAIGDGDEVGVALVLGLDALREELGEARAGFAGDESGLRGPGKLGRGGLAHEAAPTPVARGVRRWPASEMV
jgi:hypothetical protein